jgi:hypothetical protein
MLWRASSICALQSGLVARPRFCGLLHEDLAQHHLVAGLRLHLGSDLLAARCGLLQQLLHTRLGHGLAVDDGDVLRLRGRRQQQGGHGQGQGRVNGRKLGLHGQG